MWKRFTGLVVCAAAAGAVLAARPAVLAGQADTPDKGEQLQNASCLGCHDLRPIQTQALDKAGWSRVIASMVDKGAEVRSADVPVLVDYLVKNHGPLPEGPGKIILLNTCTVCHDLGRIRIQGRTPEDWNDTLSTMLNEGAMLSEQDYPVLLAYLSRHFKP